MQIDVLPATPAQEPILAQLMELYAYDFSAFTDLKLGPDGRFGYERLPLYWTESERFPFLVRVKGELAGFVLVQKGSQLSLAPDTWDMAEFFVLRGYRRQGVGVRVAQEIWKLFPGNWEVRVSESNLPAQSFWRQAIAAFTDSPVEGSLRQLAGKLWQVFSFRSEAP